MRWDWGEGKALAGGESAVGGFGAGVVEGLGGGGEEGDVLERYGLAHLAKDTTQADEG